MRLVREQTQLSINYTTWGSSGTTGVDTSLHQCFTKLRRSTSFGDISYRRACSSSPTSYLSRRRGCGGLGAGFLSNPIEYVSRYAKILCVCVFLLRFLLKFSFFFRFFREKVHKNKFLLQRLLPIGNSTSDEATFLQFDCCITYLWCYSLQLDTISSTRKT